MNARTILFPAALLAVLVSVPAWAADAKKDEEGAPLGAAPPRKLNEIERGFWVSLEAAPIAHLDWISTLPPTRLPRQLLPDDAGLGFRTGVRVGFDPPIPVVGRIFSFDGYLVQQVREKRIRRGRSYTGDLADFNAGVGLRLMPFTIRDRLSFTGRVGLGFASLVPGEVAQANANPGCLPPPSGTKPTEINPLCVGLPGLKLPANPLGWQPFPPVVFAASPTAEVMLGVEYFTHLRHFSVGAEFVLGTMLWPFQLHAAVVPHVKYSF